MFTNLYFFQSSFIVKPRRPNVILELIARTKQAVRALDNMNYKRMKKILVTDVTTEGTDDVSESGDASGYDTESINGPRETVGGFFTFVVRTLLLLSENIMQVFLGA